MTSTTKDHVVHDRFDLSEKQITAIVALDEGLSVAEAARRAGTSRQMVSGWRHHHAGFIAGMNRLHRDHIAQANGQLLRLAPKAIEVIGAELDAGGPAASRAAGDILRVIEKMAPGVVGSSDPLVVENEPAAAADHALLSALMQSDWLRE